jgi:hypothetical protein
MLPSLSLNHAALAPPAVTAPAGLLLAGHVVVLEHHARALSASISRSTSATDQNAWLACDVPALGVG